MDKFVIDAQKLPEWALLLLVPLAGCSGGALILAMAVFAGN